MRQLFNLWKGEELLLRGATWIEVRKEMDERNLSVKQVDIEALDGDTMESLESDRHFEEGLEH